MWRKRKLLVVIWSNLYVCWAALGPVSQPLPTKLCVYVSMLNRVFKNMLEMQIRAKFVFFSRLLPLRFLVLSWLISFSGGSCRDFGLQPDKRTYQTLVDFSTVYKTSCCSIKLVRSVKYIKPKEKKVIWKITQKATTAVNCCYCCCCSRYTKSIKR